MAEKAFVNIFWTMEARDTIQTVLKSAWNEKNYCSNIDLKISVTFIILPFNIEKKLKDM